jgi:nucleoside-diphosphate-sugar epimerase
LLAGTRFLITGATGRLGRDLTHRLEGLGADVDPVILPGYPELPKLVPWTARTPPRRLEGPKDLAELPSPDHVIHLHWKVDRRRPFAAQVVGELEDNVNRPSFLWDRLREDPPSSFLNASSIMVYSHLNRNPIAAADEPFPVTPYGIAKLAGERTLGALLGEVTRVVHARLGPVCSLGENPAQLFTRLRESVVNGTRITLNSQHVTHTLYIDEAVDLLIHVALAAEAGPCILAGKECSVARIASLFEEVSGGRVNAAPGPSSADRPPSRFVSDVDRFRAPWVRVVPLEEAVHRFLGGTAA